MRYFFLLIFIFNIACSKEEIKLSKDQLFYKNVYKELVSTEIIEIDDPIDEEAQNKKITKVYDKNKKLIGCLRDIVTSTGCNDGCLPVIFTLFYDKNLKFLKLLSKEGLTKKDHEPYRPEDYTELEMIIMRSPDVFKTVAHPKLMVDAVTGATLTEYKKDVIARSAYTTLRVSRYFDHTSKVLSTVCK